MSDTTYVFNGQAFHEVVGSTKLSNGNDAHLTDCNIAIDARCKTTTDGTLAATKPCSLCAFNLSDQTKALIAKLQGRSG